jgi:transcription initiation factor TFIIIB Brf1 subunit/transcription initiation factor TFIIB
MPLEIKCPNCGQKAIVPDTAINRRVRCTSCHAVYAVRDALTPPTVQHSPTPEPIAEDGMSKNEKLLIGFGLGIPALIFLVFITYWFGIRDTWEIDNYSEITARCEAVMQATRGSDDQAADQAYAELTAFIGDRSIESDSLAGKLASVNSAMAPVRERLEQARREREARDLAERNRREAQAEAQRRAQLAREAAQATSRPRERYYRDSHGAIISESEAEEKLWLIRRKIEDMPEDQWAEKAYMQGFLRALEDEWARIKRQGPIER